MAATRLADVIVPVVFNGYTREKTATLSNLWTSGIVAAVPELAWFVGRGGNTLTMPFWHDLSGNSQVVSADGTELTVSNITSDSDAAVVLARGNAWGSNELAAALAGSDPMMAIADAVAAFWARDMQDTLLAILSGLFALWQYTTPDITGFYIACFGNLLFLTMWIGPVMASCQDQVLPRMRGTATALQFLATNLIGLGLGPYTLGLVSDATGDLRLAMLTVLLTIPLTVALFVFAARRLPEAEATLLARARAAGEPV